MPQVLGELLVWALLQTLDKIICSRWLKSFDCLQIPHDYRISFFIQCMQVGLLLSCLAKKKKCSSIHIYAVYWMQCLWHCGIVGGKWFFPFLFPLIYVICFKLCCWLLPVFSGFICQSKCLVRYYDASWCFSLCSFPFFQTHAFFSFCWTWNCMLEIVIFLWRGVLSSSRNDDVASKLLCGISSCGSSSISSEWL